MIGNKILPEYVNVDLHPSLMPQDACLFLKNLIFSLDDTTEANADKGAKTGTYKTMQSTALYIDNLVLPAGVNTVFSARSCKELRNAFAFVHNSLGNHTIYRLNGADATYNIVKQGAVLNFQLKPEYFIHEGGFAVIVTYISDPVTGEKQMRTFIEFTDGYNPQRFICVEDAVATNGFDPVAFPYFQGDYDPALLISMGVPTPMDCIGIEEVPLPPEELTLENRLLYKTWQFRLRWYDVWGRMSEYGIISDLYIPGVNDCISSGSGLPRCLNLSFDAPPSYINQVEIAYRNCNDQQWYVSDTINLYNGSQLGQWWLRQRNNKVNYNSETGKITYKFCAKKDCRPIDPSDTNRLYNPLSRTSQSVAIINNTTNLGNNKDGFLPFSQDLLDKIKVTVEAPDPAINGNDFVNITVWVQIYNPYWNANQPIFLSSDPDAFYNNLYAFGAFNTDVRYRATFAYKQYFPDKTQKGFIGYLAGINSYTISKQYFLSTSGVLTEIEDYSITNLNKYYPNVFNPVKPYNFSTRPNGTFLQKFEFTNVPKGKYIFRIASHQATTLTEDLFKTSTYFKGIQFFNSSTPANPIPQNQFISPAREFYIDACEKSYDNFTDNKIPTIWEFNFKDVDVEQWYVKNTNLSGALSYGVELLETIGGKIGVNYTDYNGYFFLSTDNKGFGIQIKGYCGCSYLSLFSFNGTDTKFGYVNDWNNPVNPFNKIKYLNESPTCVDYEDKKCNYTLIKGAVKLCNSDIGIPNISVVLSEGGSAITDANGNYTIIAYDNPFIPQRQSELYFISGSCHFTDCNDGCVATIPITINKCISCVERIQEVATTYISYHSARGLLSGATYPVGVIGWDWLKRPTWVQSLGNITIPSVQQTKIFAPSRIKVDIDSTAVFPSDFTQLTFFIGDPVDIADYITWIADKVEFVDNAGQVNEEAPTQIKIYYASLIEYNAQNNYNTTVNWPFIPTNSTTPYLTDQVQFLLNGDGSFFSKAITALVKYDLTGQYFLINYTSDLADLKENAIFRLVRSKACTTISFYYEQCNTILLKNQHAAISSFYLNAFDTYYINRQIPVPIGTTQNPVNQIRIFGVPFESRSPSDFWGEGCHNIGRQSILNPDETVLYHTDQIAMSGSISETGLLNFLNFFDNDKKINFNTTNIDQIVSILPETSLILIIGTNDHFIVGFNDNIARTDANGNIIAPSTPNAFGKPYNKVGSNYGCKLRDKNTISKRQGIVKFLDTTESVLIEHDYRNAVPISKNGADGYIRAKIKEVQNYNTLNNNSRYFHGVINPINNDYLLTDFIIGSNSYINHLREYEVSAQETVAFSLGKKALKAWWSFTPEAYTFIDGDINDMQLISFKNAQPYRHYTALANAIYGRVYGEPVNRIIRLVLSVDNVKKKNMLSVAVYCKDSAYFSDQVITEVGQHSVIPLSYLRKAQYAWFAPFLCDVLTLADSNRQLATGDNKLTDGDILYGTYVDIRFVGDVTKDTTFSEIQGFIINAVGDEPTGVVQK